MKNLMENFKEFLTEDKERKSLRSRREMTLYHYAPDESLLFGSKNIKGSILHESMKWQIHHEYSFMWTQIIRKVFSNRRLYKVDVPTNRVYDLGRPKTLLKVATRFMVCGKAKSGILY